MEKVEKFILTEYDFLFVERQLLNMDFRENTRFDSARLFERLNLIPPRIITGRETSYIYKSHASGNNYSVIIHTTYLKASKKWRDTGTDAGWCLIIEGDKAKYFAKPFSRTKGFILKLLRQAWVTKWKVDHRPLCPQCHALMEINRKIEPRQYYWICRNNIRHDVDAPVFESWDSGLPLKAAKFVSIRRAYTARYHKKLKKEGSIVTPARKIRKQWEIKNPENLT